MNLASGGKSSFITFFVFTTMVLTSPQYRDSEFSEIAAL